MPAPLLSTEALTKDYPGVRALDQVSFDLSAGEVHVLFGENGAGKSTMISMLSGANQPTSGTIRIKGTPTRLSSVHAARDHGISAVFQEFSLVPQLTVQENLFLGAEHSRRGVLKKAEMRRDAERLLQELEFDLDPRATVDHLTRAEQQMVEIAKAFRSDLSVLILDEPTASLTDHETDQLFAIVERLKGRGVGIIYITHRMAEIDRIADRITVLRDGRYIATVDAKEATEDQLVQLMTGRDVGAIFPEIALSGTREEVLSLSDLSTRDGSVSGVALHAQRGEILGLAGLVGSGKSEAMQAAFGALPLAQGTVRYKGRDVTGWSPKRAIKDGFLYMPADRRREGLMMMRSVRENMSLAALDIAPFGRGPFLNRSRERRETALLAERLNLAPRAPENAVDHFSGGNQQKAMLARSLTRPFDLIVFDEPTVGVDVGTRAAIYRFIVELAEAGTAIVLISSDLPEILNLATRALVFHNGHVQAEFAGTDITEANILSNFFEKDAA